MSVTQGLPGYLSSDSGAKKTGFQGPILAGKVADPLGGPLPIAGGVMCVQSTSSIVNQIVTTSATALGSRASFIYIPVTNSAAGTWVSAAAPPYLGCGTPIVFNDTTAQLSVWSSSRASWMTLIATTSMAAGGFTTSA